MYCTNHNGNFARNTARISIEQALAAKELRQLLCEFDNQGESSMDNHRYDRIFSREQLSIPLVRCSQLKSGKFQLAHVSLNRLT